MKMYYKIYDDLYQGGNVKVLPEEVTASINLCEFQPYYSLKEGMTYISNPIADGDYGLELLWLTEMVNKIESLLEAGENVYIHCWAGVSRSAMVTAAVIMRRESCRWDTALEKLAEFNPSIDPAPPFIKLLKEFS